MALNKNHEFEDLNGIKCGIVEKNVTPQRLQFIKTLLEYNGFTVIAVPSPAPKAATVVKTEDAVATPEPAIITPETFTVGVTDYTFNTINAIFGRLLKTPDGDIVTLAYWQQKEKVSDDEVPYFEEEGK